jgi:hypothetical protein
VVWMGRRLGFGLCLLGLSARRGCGGGVGCRGGREKLNGCVIFDVVSKESCRRMAII